jgi:hypothetical protein
MAAALPMVQLLVYAAMQVPVGVLTDRCGSRQLVVLGSLPAVRGPAPPPDRR